MGRRARWRTLHHHSGASRLPGNAGAPGWLVARLTRVVVILSLLAAVVAAAYLLGRDYVRRHPQDVPWTKLSLRDPVGTFTGRKLAALADQTPQCRALLSDVGSADTPVPPQQSGPDCGYDNGMRLVPAPGEPSLSPANLVASCPVAAALSVFERQVLQPAATHHFNSRVVAITHSGSY